MKRRRMSKKSSKRSFSKGRKVHKLNKPKPLMRGGIRL